MWSSNPIVFVNTFCRSRFVNCQILFSIFRNRHKIHNNVLSPFETFDWNFKFSEHFNMSWMRYQLQFIHSHRFSLLLQFNSLLVCLLFCRVNICILGIEWTKQSTSQMKTILKMMEEMYIIKSTQRSAKSEIHRLYILFGKNVCFCSLTAKGKKHSINLWINKWFTSLEPAMDCFFLVFFRSFVRWKWFC